MAHREKAMNEALKAAQEQFTDYFVKNYPGPDTIIHDPLWHAPRIFKAALASLSAQQEQKPFGYFHELLNGEGKGSGVWIGCPDRDATEQAYIEGETGKEIVALYLAAPQASQPVSEQNARFAIDGAIDYGKQGINPPPSADHWLMPYWEMGRALASQPDAKVEIAELKAKNATLLADLRQYMNAADAEARFADELKAERDALRVQLDAIRREALEEAEEAVTALYEQAEPPYLVDICQAIRALAQAKGETK